jgi:hypothetical protein
VRVERQSQHFVAAMIVPSASEILSIEPSTPVIVGKKYFREHRLCGHL